jgi:hypothetical protein
MPLVLLEIMCERFITGARYWDLGDSAECDGLGLHRDQLLHIRIHHRTGPAPLPP